MVGRVPEPRRVTVAGGLVLVLALSTGACAHYTGARYGGPDAPLRVRLASTFELSSRSPTLHFAVSDRSHVALFRVSPSGYVRALYPYHPGGPTSFGAGPHTVFSTAARAGFGFAPSFGSPYRHRLGPFSGVGRPHLSFLMLVASRSPLRLERIRNDVPFRFRSATALASPLQGGSAFGTMDRLLDRLIPSGLASDDWAVDWVYTSVGPPGRTRTLPRRVAIHRPAPDGDSTSRSTDRTGGTPRILDTEDLPFSPPRIPTDLPEVERDGRTGEHDLRQRDSGNRRIDRTRDRGLSERFGRLFDDGRTEAEGWIPGSSRTRGADRSGRSWGKRLDEWARNPEAHEFPDPPRPPDRWRGANRRHPSVGRPGEPGSIGRIRIHRPDASAPHTPTAGDVGVTRPAGSEADGGGSRSSGGDDDGGGRHE